LTKLAFNSATLLAAGYPASRHLQNTKLMPTPVKLLR
jgi:hypothetical protein